VTHRGRDRYSDEPTKRPVWHWLIVGLGTLLVLFVLFFIFTKRVDAGEECYVQSRFGGADEVDAGVDARIPGIDRYRCFSIRPLTYEMVADADADGGNGLTTDSKAAYKDWAILGKSSEGIDFWITATVQFRIPEGTVEEIYQKYKTEERVVENVVKFHVRTVAPQHLNTKSADALYLGDLRPISAEIFEQLKPRFEAGGIEIVYFELKRPNFDDSYEQSIREKAQLIEATKKKELEQVYQQEEAERVQIESQGVADARRIQAQGEADATLIQAEADADSLQLRANVLQNNPSLIEWEAIQSLRNANVVYLPSDVLPIIDVLGGVRKGVGYEP
jgi:regulator of protease activity HflC (stomatin/prohibitin superfamily)